MRTRDNSTIISLRVEKALHREFTALSTELGALTPRKLREAYLQQLKEMRVQVNEKRALHGRPTWEEEFGTQNVEA